VKTELFIIAFISIPDCFFHSAYSGESNIAKPNLILIVADDLGEGIDITAIPNFTWCNREKGRMKVWLSFLEND
jgi:hypothetical protein